MTKLKSGQSIVEVVIATTLISIGIVAALSLANYSARQNTYAKLVNEATSYNNQAADWLRAERVRLGWGEFTAKLTSDSAGSAVAYCLVSLSLASVDFTSLAPGNCNPTDYIVGTIFVRELIVDLDSLGDGQLTATVTTSWQDKTIHRIPLVTELSQWK